jgi:hypothetical protein
VRLRGRQRFATDRAGVDVVLHGHDGRPMRLTRKFGGTYMLQLTARGLYMGVARATFAPDGSIATFTDGTVGMDQRFEDSEAIAKLFKA